MVLQIKLVRRPLQVRRRQTCIKTLEKHSLRRTNPGFLRAQALKKGEERMVGFREEGKPLL